MLGSAPLTSNPQVKVRKLKNDIKLLFLTNSVVFAEEDGMSLKLSILAYYKNIINLLMLRNNENSPL